MKVALVYDRVNKWGGAERVLIALHEMFPSAPLYTSVYAKEKAQWSEVFPEVIPSFLQKIPFLHNKHEKIPFLMPLVFETINLSKYDLVITVTSESAKGVITGKNTLHVCYCLTPTRYLWSGYDEYFPSLFLKKITYPGVRYLRYWDRISAQRPDQMVAISQEVKKRIKKYYHRNSVVIHPPVETDKFFPTNIVKKDFYLVVSRLVPYKKIDLAVKAFNQIGLPLVVIGTGSELAKLQHIAQKNIRFLGSVSDRKLAKYYNMSQALIFPQKEDFGLTAVEAQASGTPVIAYRGGGALDTVEHNKTGLFFKRQDVKSLIESVYQFQKMRFNKEVLLAKASHFSKEEFKRKMNNLIYDGRR